MRNRGAIAFATGALASLAAGWLAFPRVLYEPVQQPAAFNHKVHTGEKGGMSCADCHPLGDDGRFAGLPALAGCANCHAQPLGNTEAERRFIDQYVTAGREPQWLVYARQPDSAYFPHAAHVKRAGLACSRCHGAHGETASLRPLERNRISGYSRDVMHGPRRMRMDDCVDCHRQHGLEHSCLDCHK